MNRKDLKKCEEIFNYKIPAGPSIVVRVDGNNFKKVTEKLNKPFDKVFTTIMETVLEEVAPTIEGCRKAYMQSDEITFIISYFNNETPLYGNRIQKIAALVASKVSVAFYKNFLSFILEYQDQVSMIEGVDENEEIMTRITNLWSVVSANPVFDAKVFTVTEEDEDDVIEIRQNFCITNSINAMADAYLGHQVGKSQDELLNDLYKAGHKWDDLDDVVKFGKFIFRSKNEKGKVVWSALLFEGSRAMQLINKENERKNYKEKRNNESK